MVRHMDVTKESGVTEDVDCGLIVQKNARHGYGEIVLMESFGAPAIGNNPACMIQCSEGGFQVALGLSSGYHCEAFKKVIGIGVYIKGRHEYFHVVVGRFPGANICMCLTGLDPGRALVDEVEKCMAPEALNIAEVPRLPLNIIGLRLAFGQVVIIMLHKDHVARGCM